MMRELGKPLNKEGVRHVSNYLDDPQKNFDSFRENVALGLRHPAWKKAIEAAYNNEYGGKLPIVIFQGGRHDIYVTTAVKGLIKKGEKSEPKDEL